MLKLMFKFVVTLLLIMQRSIFILSLIKSKVFLEWITIEPKKKNWILLSSYKDESLVRGESVLSITHEIYNVEDYYVSDIRYVEVTANTF